MAQGERITAIAIRVPIVTSSTNQAGFPDIERCTSGTLRGRSA
jgi:hypothetical protein